MSRKPQQNPLVCHGHTRPIVQLAYSEVTPDGYFLTSASKDGSPMLRNGATGDWIGTFQGHKGAVWCCALNKPALLAATASADFSAKLWDAVSGDEKNTFAHKHIVRTVHFHQDSTHLITAGHEKLIRVFDLNRPEAEPSQLTPAAQPIRSISTLQQDQLILVTYVDKPNIDIWDARSNQVERTLETPQTVLSLEVCSTGKYLTSAGGKQVQFWDAESFAPIKSFDFDYNVESATYCPAKHKFAVGGEDMWAHLHDFKTGAEVDCNKGHHGPVHCIRFAPDGESYASGSEDGTIRIWDTEFSSKQATNGTAAVANGA